MLTLTAILRLHHKERLFSPHTFRQLRTGTYGARQVPEEALLERAYLDHGEKPLRQYVSLRGDCDWVRLVPSVRPVTDSLRVGPLHSYWPDRSESGTASRNNTDRWQHDEGVYGSAAEQFLVDSPTPPAQRRALWVKLQQNDKGSNWNRNLTSTAHLLERGQKSKDQQFQVVLLRR